MSVRAADNPFRAECLDRLEYRFGSERWASALGRLAELEWRATVVGPRGHGKTTLLDTLAARLRDRGHRVLRTRIDARHRRQLLHAAHEGDCVLLDGVETLDPLRARWLVSRLSRRLGRPSTSGGWLILSCHTPRLLPTWIECRTSPALLHELAAELDPDRYPELEPILDELFARRRGNLRDCLMELYDLVSRAELSEASWRPREASGAVPEPRP